MSDPFKRAAQAINDAYAAIPPEHHDALDRLRQEQGAAFANAGLINYEAFNETARTVMPKVGL